MDEALVARYPDLEQSHFWWAARRRLVSNLVGPFVGPNQRVLDIGCGSGVTGSMLAGIGAEVVGVDLEAPRLVPQELDTKLQGSIEFLSGDYLSLAKDLGRFDLVLALDAIEHFANEETTISAIRLNLKDKGRLLVTVPAYEWLWSSHDEENRHFRRYTRRTLHGALTRSGFRVLRVGYAFSALLLPKTAVAIVERSLKARVKLGSKSNGLMNDLAMKYFFREIDAASRRADFMPFGTSVVALATTA